MSITTKDMVFGGATAAAFLGLIVYNEAKFKKMQCEIDRLNQETKVLAQYVKLLESQMASELHGGHAHHHHQVGASNTASIQGQPGNAASSHEAEASQVQARQPQQPHSHRQEGHQHHHSAQPHAGQHASHHPHAHHSNPRSHHSEPAPQRERIIPRREPVRQEPPPEEDSDEGSDSPQNSNRRPSSSVPRNPAMRSEPRPSAHASRPAATPSRPMVDHSATRRVLRRPEPEAEEKPPAPASQRKQATDKGKEEADEPPASQRKVRVQTPKEEEAKKAEVKEDPPRKKFAGKTDDDEPTEKMISARRPKSSLKNNGAGTGDEVAMDEDLLNDIETVAKSSGRSKASKVDNEGRPEAESGHKARAANTAARAEAMRKQSEERRAARAAKQPA